MTQLIMDFRDLLGVDVAEAQKARVDVSGPTLSLPGRYVIV